jgi:hypothetical protein
MYFPFEGLLSSPLGRRMKEEIFCPSPIEFAHVSLTAMNHQGSYHHFNE